MKKIISRLLMMAIGVATFFACGSGGGSPEAVAEGYLKAIQNENWSAAKKLSTESTHQFIDFVEGMVNMAKMSGEKVETKKSGKMENLKCVIEGDICNCTFETDGEPQNLKLVMVNGKWLVEQSKEIPGFGESDLDWSNEPNESDNDWSNESEEAELVEEEVE